MKKCPFCAEEIQDAAKACPHCQRALKPDAKTLATGIGCLSLLVLLFVGWCASLIRPTDEQQQAGRVVPSAAAPSVPPAMSDKELEALAAKFSPTKFSAAMTRLETLVRKSQWAPARVALHERRVELDPVLKSTRGSEPAVRALRARLQQQELAIDAQIARERATEKARAEEASTIDAKQLFAAFEANEIRANQALKGKRFRVRGRIDKIGTDILNAPYVSLDAAQYIFSVQAMFPRGSESKLAALNIGQMLTVECRCDGKLGNVILSDCKIE